MSWSKHTRIAGLQMFDSRMSSICLHVDLRVQGKSIVCQKTVLLELLNLASNRAFCTKVDRIWVKWVINKNSRSNIACSEIVSWSNQVRWNSVGETCLCTPWCWIITFCRKICRKRWKLRSNHLKGFWATTQTICMQYCKSGGQPLVFTRRIRWRGRIIRLKCCQVRLRIVARFGSGTLVSSRYRNPGYNS